MAFNRKSEIRSGFLNDDVWQSIQSNVGKNLRVIFKNAGIIHRYPGESNQEIEFGVQAVERKMMAAKRTNLTFLHPTDQRIDFTNTRIMKKTNGTKS